MLYFPKPADHGRFNATLHQLIHMRFNGSVCIAGAWDMYETLAYLERRMKMGVIPTLRSDGAFFTLRGKNVIFTNRAVYVTTVWLEALAISLSHLS